MAYKTFIAGEEALAGDVNSYLMSQAVPRFASAAARTAAIAAPVFNQLSILDTSPGQVHYWNGSAWADSIAKPLDRYIEAAPGVVAGSNAANAYDFPSLTVQRTGALIFEGAARVSAPGQQLITVDVIASATGPAPSNATVGAVQDSYSLFQATVPIFARWANIAAGTALVIKVRIAAGNSPSQATLIGVAGVVRHVTEF